MRLLRKIIDFDLVQEALDLTRNQRRLIEDQRSIITDQQTHILRMNLVHTRAMRSLVEHFLVVQEEGWDVRDALLEGLRDLDDHVARLEEHAPP